MSRYRSRLLPFIEQWTRRGARVAIFGTGPHTDFLFHQVPELATLDLVGFLESNPAAGATYRELPVHRLEWARGHADVILCSSHVSECRMAVLVESLDCKVVTSHAVCGESQAETERGGLRSDWEELTARFDAELGAYRRADAVAVLTEAERRALAPLLGADRVFVVPNAHPTHPQVPGWGEREGFVFLAGFRHPPNVDAALYLLDEIMPIVWRRMPGATLTLLGADVPLMLHARAGDRVLVTGYVHDLAPHLFRARVAVAPLRYGAGVKGKLLQAFGHGLANVTTSIGAENMALTPGVDVVIADTPQAFADEMLRVYADRALWQQLVDHGRVYLERHHSPALVQRALLSALLPSPAENDAPEFRRLRAYEALATGQTRLHSRDVEGATQEFARAAALSPETDLWLTIAHAWSCAQRPDLATEALSHSVALSPDDPTPRIALADAWESSGDWARALRTIDDLVATSAGDVPVALRARRARLLTLVGRYEEAEAEWTALVADVPEETRLRFWRGRARHGRRDFPGATEDYGVALRAALDGHGYDEGCAIDRWLRAALRGEHHRDGRGLAGADVAWFRSIAPLLHALGERRGWQPPPCSDELSHLT